VIPEIGHFALWLATAIALVQALLALVPKLYRRTDLHDFVTRGAVMQALLTLIAFAALSWCFRVSDFSVELVATNSHTLKPLLYKYTGVWANHEGSLLLWITIMALAGGGVALFGRRLGEAFRTRVLGVQALIGLGFYIFLLFASNPFARIVPAPVEGSGLNPLLQDPGLAFHPPLLYAGYVGLSVTFAFAVAALIDRQVGPQWARLVRPWLLLAWAFLTAGIALGSYWAYYELGWGGWWFWDPVENASLMPWLAATALLHSVSVLAARNALRNWTMLLAVASFSFSMMGTFIVRSGLLTSVHAFATDPTRGTFLLVLLALYIGGALILYAVRAHSVDVGSGFAAVSREGVLVVNNLIMAALLGIILLGTLYPLMLEGVTGEKISVGAPYFEATTLPFILAMALLMVVGPFLAWRKVRMAAVLKSMRWPALLLVLVAIGVAYFGKSLLAIVALAIAAALGATSLVLALRFWRVPLRLGMALAHLGIAVTMVGATVNGAWGTQTLANMAIGDTVRLGDFDVTLQSIMPTAGSNYTAIQGTLVAQREGKPIGTMIAQSRTYASPPMETTESGLQPLWYGDLYAALGKPDGKGHWQVRLQWHPMVRLIWLGALLMALGGIIAIFGGSAQRARSILGEVPA